MVISCTFTIFKKCTLFGGVVLLNTPLTLAEAISPEDTDKYYFESSFGRELFYSCIHAGTLSMANAGRNTNGNRFFICTEITYYLDGKHIVFGRVVSGMNIAHQMEKCGSSNGKTSKRVVIVECGES